jgi:CHAD domain-containing protein
MKTRGEFKLANDAGIETKPSQEWDAPRTESNVALPADATRLEAGAPRLGASRKQRSPARDRDVRTLPAIEERAAIAFEVLVEFRKRPTRKGQFDHALRIAAQRARVGFEMFRTPDQPGGAGR